jgi:hypothetical protein
VNFPSDALWGWHFQLCRKKENFEEGELKVQG